MVGLWAQAASGDPTDSIGEEKLESKDKEREEQDNARLSVVLAGTGEGTS